MDRRRLTRALAISAAALCAAGCAAQPKVAAVSQSRSFSFTAADRDCMARAMYFESHRSADEGMLAVGTVVANRVESGRYGASVCDVVSQKRQFAPGVMTRTMEGEAAERARRAADAVLSGKRHPGVRKAMFFHTAGLKFRYPNMHYVLVAGGNAFYEKRSADTQVAQAENAKSRALALAYARVDPTAAAKPIVVASLDPAPAVPPVTGPSAPPRTVATSAAPAGPKPAADDIAESREAAPVAYAAAPAPATTAIPAPTPRPVMAASVARPASPSPEKRVLAPERLTPALASALPAPAAQPAPAAKDAPAAQTSGASPVADAFAAFELR
jgi:spore germination cell wall hydrolase CwlJ-like protein